MLVTMLKSMLHEYAQRRHSSHEVHGTAALLRPGTDGATTPRRYSEDAQHWIGRPVPFFTRAQFPIVVGGVVPLDRRHCSGSGWMSTHSKSDTASR
ncbi:hypothetical protein MTO96_015576 [Rhipicephalus appendiculatus]